MYLKVLNDSCCGGGPLDLTGCTEIDVALPNADGTFTHYLLSEGQIALTLPENLGKFSVPIPADNSALLNVGEYQSFTATFTIASEIFSVRFFEALSVFQE